MLKSPNPEVRLNAASTMLYFRKQGTAEALFSLLSDKNPETQVLAADLLSEIIEWNGDESCLNLLSSNDSSKKLLGLRMIAKNPPSDCLPRVKEALNDTIKEIKIEAIEILGRMKDTYTIVYLFYYLQDLDEDLKNAAIKSISSKKESVDLLRLMLQVDDCDLNKTVLSCFSELDENDIPSIIADLLYSNSMEVRNNTIKCLFFHSSQSSLDYLNFALFDGYNENRALAVERLLFEDNVRFRENAYILSLQDESQIVRWAGLTYMDDNDALFNRELLVKSIFDEDQNIRKKAAIRLSRARLKVYNEFQKYISPEIKEWDGFWTYVAIRKVPETKDILGSILKREDLSYLHMKTRNILNNWTNLNEQNFDNGNDEKEDDEEADSKTISRGKIKKKVVKGVKKSRIRKRR